ncbi:MAG: right-handed parallel beta-helix repeat-containing protein, partial [Chloroflexi bacterium]|nr:right-handed parallel beta-helix repeat-containing protein [Chloroflexota bacterium]
NITAPDYPPVADPDGPYVAYVDRPLTLDGSGSYDPDEWMGDAVAEYLWDFGDGDVVSTMAPTVEHAWSAEGLYTVTLEVRDRGPEYGLDSPQWSTPVETTVTVEKWVPLRIFIYDDYEEQGYDGSLREYLESQGHYVTYSHDNVGNIDVWADYANHDVILAIHTVGGGTLTNLQTWFQSGRGYVAMLGGGMWNDPPEDDYIMNLLGVGTNGDAGEGWWPDQLTWADPAHPIAHAPNSGWDITDIPDGQYQYYVDITDGHTLVSGPEGAVVQSREGVEDAARIVVIGTNYHGDDRSDPEARYLVENALTWASGFRSAVWVMPSYQWQAGAAGTTVNHQVQVVNRVSHDDTFALAVADNVWPTTIWDEAGTTEITDTGLIPDNDFVMVTVKVDIPAGVSPGESDRARIIATSVSDPAISDEAEVETSGPDVPAHVAVAAIPPAVMPGGDTTTIEARVTDENGIQVVDGTVVTFTMGSGQGTVYPTTSTTVGGVVNATFTSGPDCGLARVDADAGTAAGFTTVSVGDAGPTDVPGGSMTSDTTWTACASPYLVHGDVFVEPGVTLTVELGVQVRFDGDTGLYVLGTLSALGEPDNQIAFTANEDWPWPGYWKGLTFGDGDHAAGGGLEQAIVDYAGQWQNWDGRDFAAGVLIYRGAPHITHSLIRRNLGDGLWAARDSLPLITDNDILENGGGIAMNSAYLVASDIPIPSGEEADVWWRYLAFSTPGAGWNSDLDFDDSSWNTGGTPIGDGWNYNTYLDLEGDTMYARKIVTPASPLAANYYLRVIRDDMVTVWVNGVAVYADTQGGGPQWTSYIPVTLTPGANLIAVELQDSGLGANYFDLELAGGSLQRATVSGNTLRGNGTNGWAAIYINNSSPLVQGNEVAWNHQDGILMEGYSAPIIENNLVHHNGGNGIYFRDEVLPTIVNNTIDRNAGAGTSWDWSSVPEIVNNIITNNGEAGIACGSWRMAIRYNDVWNNQGDYSGCDVGEGNTSQDPLFVDGPGGDYHLQAGSLCIDAGTADGAPDHDFEGDPRPWGFGVDMGADEALSAPVPVSWLRFPLGTDPPTLDINLATDTTSHLVLNQLMGALYRYEPDGSTEPAGATGYEISEDGRVYTITLRADALWSDGVPVIAQHYVDGIIRLLDPDTGSENAWLMYFIEGAEEFNTGQTADPSTVGVRAVNIYTLEITLTDPLAFFPSILALYTTYPVRLDIIQSDPDWTEAGHFVGNGPYVLTKWDHGNELIVEKNPLYHDANQVSIEKVVFPIIADTAVSLAAYESSLLDVSDYPPEELSRILADPVLSKELHRLPRPGVYYLGVNTLRWPTDSLLVRKALASAIDRQHIISDVLYSPWREYATGVIPPEIPGYQGKAVGYDFDVTTAQQFLSDAGYPGGEGFPGVELWYNEGNEDVCESVASMWEDNLGITVTTVTEPWSEYLDMLDHCDNPAECTYGAYRMGWVMDYGDANDILNVVFHPDSPFQYTGWDNARYRELMDLGLTETDQALRIEYYQEAERILVEDEVAVIPILFYDRSTLIKSNITFEYPPFGAPHFMKWSKTLLPTISDVRTTNVRDTSLTVSWITDIPSDGRVNYGTDPSNMNQTAYDDRGPDTFDDTHYVTLEELLPNTTYYFDVVSGPTTEDNGGAHYTVTTGPTLGLPSSDTIFGQVFKEDEVTPAEGAIVYITLFDDDGSDSPDEAAPLSALVDDTGYWYANLGNARTSDLSAYFTYSASGDKLRLEAQGAADGTGYEPAVDTVNDTPAPTIYLSHTVIWEISLQVGWNHVSLPLDPLTSYTAEGVCDEIISQGGDVTEIDRWYASGWDGHICGLPFNDFAIELGADYFIKSSAASIWTIEGYPVTTPVPLDLQIGWNSIGIPHTDAYTAQSLCDEINDQCGDGTAVEVDRWHASGWDGHICGLPFNNFDIEIGTGYFVKASGNCTVTPSLAAASRSSKLQVQSSKFESNAPRSPKDSDRGEVWETKAAIAEVKVTNVRDTSFTVSWSTDVMATGWVNYGTSPALGQTAYDDRGAGTSNDTHHITLLGLMPETTYYFDVISDGTVDGNNGHHYSVTTGPTLGVPASDTIYG